MKVPKARTDILNYLYSVADFATYHSWIYKTRSTDVLIEGVLDEYKPILEELGCLPSEELNQIVSGTVPVALSPKLSHILKTCSSLSLEIPMCEELEKREILDEKDLPCKGMSKKKFHEAQCLGLTVSKFIVKEDISTLIDIGSGLGYVDRAICTNCESSSIIAIEADPVRSHKADCLNHNFNGRITQFCIKIEDDSIKYVSKFLQEKMEISPSCLIALHACGDLTVNCFRLMEVCDIIKSSILVSCCYHKMSQNYFPLNPLIYLEKSYDIHNLMPTTFLRLAADRTKENFLNWTTLHYNQHTFNNLARAVIELYIFKEGFEVTKSKRKCVRRTALLCWDSYLSDWLDRHSVTRKSNGGSLDKEELAMNLTNFWSEYKRYFDAFKGLLILQICFQAVAEAFILIDRLLYLMQKDCYSSVKLMRIAEPNISARSIAFVINKK